ncbi:MAG: F0F1 ATP synthase subunit B [Erysipelotrichaceae bacterium]
MTFDIVGKLVPNPISMLVQLCATGLLFFFVYKYLYHPILDYLDKKSDLENKQLLEAEKLNKEANQSNLEAKERLKEAAMGAKDILNNARKESLKIQEDTLKETNEKVNKKINDAKLEIEQERSKMQSELSKEIIDIALQASAKLLNEKANDQLDKQNIEKFVRDLRQ